MDIMRMDFEQWLEIGIRQGFCTPPVCDPHEGIPLTLFEQDDWNEGNDTCIHVLRLCESRDQQESIEMNNEWIQRWRKGAGY